MVQWRSPTSLRLIKMATEVVRPKWLAYNNTIWPEVLRILRMLQARVSIFHRHRNALTKLSAIDTKHVPCKFFRQGACQAGQACPFLHSTDTTIDTAPCKYFTKVRDPAGLREYHRRLMVGLGQLQIWRQMRSCAYSS